MVWYLSRKELLSASEVFQYAGTSGGRSSRQSGNSESRPSTNLIITNLLIYQVVIQKSLD